MNNNYNILMTGAGAPGAAGIIRCLEHLEHAHITVADANENVSGKYLAQHFARIPAATHPEFISSLLSLCKQNHVNFIIPLVTRELLPLAQNADLFLQAGTRLLISNAASLSIALNKGKLYEFLQWRGVPVPSFSIVETLDQFDIAVRALGYPDKPVCFKPCSANGSRGFRILSASVNELELLFNQKPDSTYARLDDIRKTLASGTFPELLVSEFLPGEEYSVDCLANHGEALLVVPRLRKRMVNGISVEGEFIEHAEIIQYCKRIIRELNLHSNIGIQVKRSADNEFRILEINPRLQGAVSSGLGAGVNLPVLGLKLENDEPLNVTQADIRWGTRFSRYWQEVFY